MSVWVKKVLLLLLAIALLAGTGQVQTSLNHDRAQLDLTRTTPLADAPPMLAFTTVALGGFRGLISNFLWIRANKLQQADKYFEAVQLADWITDLEPHFAKVWAYQAWNMAWNISVKFNSFPERWGWVQRGIELLRDDGLRYNPNNALIYFNLSWIFQFKMGGNLDDASQYYKTQWADEMTPFFGPEGTNVDALANPQTPEAKERARLLREKYKMDPAFVKKVNEQWGPLDWRVPEASAIYWAAMGLEKAKESPAKVATIDLTQLRRVIYQSLLQAFYHGRLVINPFNKKYEFYPDLDLIPRVNNAYETMYAEESTFGQKSEIETAQRNFLGDAVYFLYEDNQVAKAAKWFRSLCRKYPNKAITGGPIPSHMTLDQFVMASVQQDIGETDQNRITAAVEGLLTRAYSELAIGHDDYYEGYKRLAAGVYEHYQGRLARSSEEIKRKGLPPFAEMNRAVLAQLLDPHQGLPFAARAVLRTQLRLPAETHAIPPAAISTNQPSQTSISTNTAPVSGK